MSSIHNENGQSTTTDNTTPNDAIQLSRGRRGLHGPFRGSGKNPDAQTRFLIRRSPTAPATTSPVSESPLTITRSQSRDAGASVFACVESSEEPMTPPVSTNNSLQNSLSVAWVVSDTRKATRRRIQREDMDMSFQNRMSDYLKKSKRQQIDYRDYYKTHASRDNHHMFLGALLHEGLRYHAVTYKFRLPRAPFLRLVSRIHRQRDSTTDQVDPYVKVLRQIADERLFLSRTTGIVVETVISNLVDGPQ